MTSFWHLIKTLNYSTESSSLKKFLVNTIRLKGPISTAEYMQNVLVHPAGGFYNQKKPVIGGIKADFVTSPEISQIFGEIMGLWYIATMGSTLCPIQLVELGPGRGTLAADMLRISRNFPQVRQRITHIDLVEVSQQLRKTQAQTLGFDWNHVRVFEDGMVHTIKQNDVECSWYPTIDAVPRRPECYKWITAHEFFDALPVYIFERSEKSWREVMVGLKTNSDELCFVLSPEGTDTKAKAALASDAYYKSRFESLTVQPGDRLEISPAASAAAKQMSSLLNDSYAGGASLIVDYGHEHFSERYTLRGIMDHKFVHPLSDPGRVDVSADVDFGYLKHLFETSLGSAYAVMGPVEQRQFLSALHAKARLEQLLKNPQLNNSQRQELVSGYNRLTEEMGSIYKFLCISTSST